jgi:hypothetical protein
MNAPLRSVVPRLLLATVFIAAVALGVRLPAQTQSPEQVLAAMEKCREQVISRLSFSDKMKMKAAMGAIANNPELIAANNAVTNAPTPQAQVDARKSLAKMKLDLIEKQDPSLKPIVEKIRAAQASVLK